MAWSSNPVSQRHVHSIHAPMPRTLAAPQPHDMPRRQQILHALRLTPGLSKVDLARRLHMSPATAGLLVAELQEAGLIVPRGLNHMTGGRPSERLALSDGKPLVLAVHLSRTGVVMAIVNLAGQVIARDGAPFRWSGSSVSVEAVIEAIHGFLRGFDHSVVGIGLGAPGLVDREAGVVRYAAHFGWRDVPLRRMLAATTSIPVTMDHSPIADLIGEDWWGSTQSADPAFFVVLGPEVGISMRIGGRIVRGATGGAGEFGHVTIDPAGPLCACGRRGCLEALASTVALRRRYADLRAQQSPDRPAETSPPTVAQIAEAAEGGDAQAAQALTEVACHVGSALAMLVNVLNPQLIVLAEELMEAEQFVLPLIRDAVERGALRQLVDSVEIRPSTFGTDAPLIGAGTMALDSLFKAFD